MNILKALEGLSPKTQPADAPKTDVDTQTAGKTSEPATERPNPMASVLERHEQISNRVRTRSQGK